MENIYTFQNQHLDVKHTQVHGYYFYPGFHQVQSQEGVALVTLSIFCEGLNNHTCRLVCLYQGNNNCEYKALGEKMSERSDILL